VFFNRCPVIDNGNIVNPDCFIGVTEFDTVPASKTGLPITGQREGGNRCIIAANAKENA